MVSSYFAAWSPLGEAEELLFLPSRITNEERILEQLAVPAHQEKQRTRGEKKEGKRNNGMNNNLLLLMNTLYEYRTVRGSRGSFRTLPELYEYTGSTDTVPFKHASR